MRYLARRLFLLGLIVGAGFSAGLVCAQDYPAKPVRIIVPFPAGTGVDVATRQVAARMGPLIGQPMLVENRPGASGIIGTEAAAKAAPDGYTIHVGPITTVALIPFLYAKLPFDMTRDFAAITQLSLSYVGIMVHPDIPVRNLQELIEFAKKRPINVGNTGVGSNAHLYSAWFAHLTGAQVNFISYNTSTPAQDLLSGRLDAAFDGLPPYLGSIKAGKLKLLVLAGKARQSAFPDVPTFVESGLADYEMYAWSGLFAPVQVAQPIIARLGEAAARAIKSPDLVEQYRSQGAEAIGNTPAEATAFFRSEQAKWKRIIDLLGIKLQ